MRLAPDPKNWAAANLNAPLHRYRKAASTQCSHCCGLSLRRSMPLPARSC